MPTLIWLSVSFVLSPAGFWWLEMNRPGTISLGIASCALSSAAIGAFFTRTRPQFHVHAAFALFLSAFLMVTNVYFLM